MTIDPLALLTEVDRATRRVLRAAAALDDAAVRAPSRLPGWTRGHVLAHLSRNADAYTNLLTWARTGVRTPAYASAEARAADIEAGADRPAAEQVADLTAAHERFATAAAEMPAEAWAATVSAPEDPQPAARVVWRRLREVEVHHVDLGVGYGPEDWPEAFRQHLLREVVNGLAARPDAPALVLRPDELRHPLPVGEAEGAVTVAGPAHLLAAWLTGRGDGAGLAVTPAGSLPAVPEWM